jgi:hypothetical protein
MTSVWKDHATYRTGLDPGRFEAYIVYSVVLFSMNKTMHGCMHPNHSLEASLASRLEQYQTITRLHSEIAAYMQIQTLTSYSSAFENFENELNPLTGDASAATRYTTDKIRKLAHNLS